MVIKVCCTCKVEKSVKEFSKDRCTPGGVYRMCKKCKGVYTRARAKESRNLLWEIKETTPCKDCGVIFHPAAMDFDHIDASSKVACVSNMKLGNREKMMNEIKKCEVVCSNCHRVRTYIRKVISD